MERLTGHEQLQELLGAYALDAVEPYEAEVLERHLPTCPRCRNELADHREVAALLSYAGGTAPGGVWDRIIASLEEPPPALTLTRAPVEAVAAPNSAAPNSPAPTSPALTTSDPTSPGQVDLDAIGGRWGPQMPPSIHARGPEAGSRDNTIVPISRKPAPRSRRSVPMRFMVAVATVAAVLVAALGIEVGRLQSSRPQQLTNLSALAYRAADADPRARHLTLRSPDGVHTVRAVMIADGTTYIGPGNLAVLPSTETYQMWGIVDGARVSLGVFGTNPTYASFTTPAVANTLAMTVETRGGVVASFKTPVVAAALPA